MSDNPALSKTDINTGAANVHAVRTLAHSEISGMSSSEYFPRARASAVAICCRRKLLSDVLIT